MVLCQEIAMGDADGLARVEALARVIWPVCYGGILAAGQVAYMLDRMYSAAQLAADQRAGVTFVLASHKAEAVGFAAWGPSEHAEVCKLHKLYVLPTLWGRGVGSELLASVDKGAVAAGYRAMRLNVNKFNQRAIAVYHAKGFVRVADVVVDIGGGYVMDDYVMERRWG